MMSTLSNKGGYFYMNDIEVRVVNSQGQDVARNGHEQGEIIIRGHGVSSEHVKSSNHVDGWLHTGDIGTIDKEGKITIIQSNKDLTNNDGGKVSAFELESLLSKHPAIQDIVLKSTPDVKLGEVLHAFVVLHENFELTEQELLSFAKAHSIGSHYPKKITFMEEFPKTTSGKILRTQLGK